jgi:hypothetical protein
MVSTSSFFVESERESMRVREACTSPLVHTEARLCSTRTSVAQKEGQNFSDLADSSHMSLQKTVGQPLQTGPSFATPPIALLTIVFYIWGQNQASNRDVAVELNLADMNESELRAGAGE